MHQRIKLLQAFKDAGLTESRNRKVQEFLKLLSDNPKICWPEAVQEFRQKYYDIYDDIASVILGTKDNLIISNFFKHTDWQSKKESSQIKNFVRNSDSYKNESIFKQLAETHFDETADVLLEKRVLPQSVQTALSLQRRNRELTAIHKRLKDKAIQTADKPDDHTQL